MAAPQAKSNKAMTVRIQPLAQPESLPHNELLCADGLLTVGEAMAFTQLSRSAIYRAMAAGWIPWVRLGGTRRIPKKGLLKMVAGNLTGGWNVPAPGP